MPARPARGYVVMPGGLTRVASGPDQRVISMQMGGSSKDTWVLTDGAVNPVTLLAGADGQFHPVRGDERLASRTVEKPVLVRPLQRTRPTT